MMIHRFSSLVRGVLAVGLAGLALGGCGDDDPSCDGVLRDGTCYVTCDEAIDCTGGGKCVAYTDPADGINHAEGKCFSPCADSAACGAGQVCVARSSLKGESVSVCQSRAVAGLPAGNVGDGCADSAACDEGAGLVCLDGACALPPAEQGASCADRACVEGLVCFQDRCRTPLGDKGEVCGEERGCNDPLVCLDGTCQAPFAGPGEACDAGRLCDKAAGLACSDGRCLYGCTSFEKGSCGDGYGCVALAKNDNGFTGVCRPADPPPDSGDGQFGTACPKGNECADGFTCVAGENPAGNYCSKTDGCTADDQCPSGYWCGSVTRLTADKKQIDFDNPNRLCLQRDFCSPCATDLDCSFTAGAICVPDADGERFCSLPCNSAKNSCVIGASCVEVEQRDGVPVTACRPDVGICHAKGAPTGCEPCRINSDCGDKALCADGAQGNKPSLKWCETPCGAPDADGKRPCPIAPNGAEMICLDENLYTLGGPIKPEDSPLYGTCFRPYTVDNTTVGTKDPANHVCGDGKRENDEECDDGNSSTSDGCDNCKITSKCRFTLGPVVGPGQPASLTQGTTTYKEIPSSCQSFRVEGTIVNAGDVGEFRFPLNDGVYSWFSVSTGAPDSCTTDLVATVQTGDYDAATDTLDITANDGSITPCAQLTTTIKNLDNPEAQFLEDVFCKGEQALACGSCTSKGLCGVCDDDSGIGNCPRMLLTNTTGFQGYKVKFASVKQQARIYARDGKSTNVKFVAIADRLANGSQGPKFTPTLSCY